MAVDRGPGYGPVDERREALLNKVREAVVGYSSEDTKAVFDWAGIATINEIEEWLSGSDEGGAK
jgi:hypothetical protein